MRKRVILTLIKGSFEQGFPAILRIREGSTLHETETLGRLPPALNILRVFNSWQAAYDQWQSTYRIRPNPGQVTNFSCREIASLGSQLADALNNWLNSDSREWQKIRDQFQRSLSETDEIQFIIQTEDIQLRQLPWHLWDLFSEHYTKAEIALSAPKYQPPPLPNPTNKVKILAILGDSTGINVEQDRAILQKELPGAEIRFLTQPELKPLNDSLWEQQWDILFFAGHSSSQADGSTGQIYINQDDSLSLRDLRNALRKAISRGLQLAIFNSCDGLGLAQELADLNIPQIIVMRKPVPDFVAQEFLRHFLKVFASGKSLYLAVREARERLQGLENQFPCASWLPVICQNPTKEPLTWQGLHARSIRQCWLPLLQQAIVFLLPILILSGTEPNSKEAKEQVDLIYQEVLGRDAKPAVIAGHVNDLTKGRTLSEIRSQTANSEEAKNKINSIYQEVLGRDAEPYEQKSQMDLLAEEATLSSIRAGITRTSSLLQNGNVISLECLGHLPGSKILDGRAGNVPVALTALIDGQSTGTKWKVHVINDGVIALENQGKIPGSTWLNGLTYAKAVNLAPNTKHPHTGTKWKIHIISDGVIALENQGHVPGSTWLDGETGEGKVKLVSYPNPGFTGTRWRVALLKE
ncbi:CHAT domain-containing protein [Trichocoleus desertorum AS-A10]|uniref:CHAT domain-containing protein n=1 Tax=Trichocoleus desertorum TaxID=1481672 RepID=UPI003297170F